MKSLWTSILILSAAFTSYLNAEPGWVFLPGEDYVEPPQAAGAYATQSSSVPVVPEGDEITDEIAALARGLQHDPVAIYNYVRNEIEHIPYYGLTKGAALCLIEKSGNDFDQCALLAALLVESGYTPIYHYGTMTIPLNAANDMDMLSWLPATNSNGVKRILNWTGNPNFNPTGSNFNPVRVWIEVEVDGTARLLDPAYKHYEDLTPLADVLTEAGYDAADYIADAAGSATLSGVDPDYYTEDLDDDAIYTRLTQDTQSLLTNLKANYPNRSPREIIGGRALIREEIPDTASLPQSLPFTSSSTETWNYGEIPQAYATSVNFNITSRMNVTLFTAELQGKRLALTLNSSTGSTGTRAALWLDDTKIGEESSSVGSTANMRITMTHPSTTFTAGNRHDGGRVYKRGANYALIYGFDATGGLMNHRQKKLEAYRADGLGNESREVLTETLNVIGQQWLYQTELFQRISATIDPSLLYFNYHRFGRMSQEEGFYIDVPLQTFVSMNRTGSFIPGNPAIFSSSYFASAMEHGVLQQTQGADKGAVSTIKMLETANRTGGRAFFADSGNFQTGDNIRSKLTGYASNALDSINAVLNQSANNFIILPQKGNFDEGDWTGTGYMQIRGNAIGMIIAGQYGGYSTNYGTISTPTVYNQNIASPTYYSYNPPSLINPTSWDPVDMATGAFLLDSTDIALGDSAPRGLAFSRSYNSLRRADDSSELGFGWTHNWKGSVTIRSAVDAGLGETTTAEAAPLMLAAAAVNDLIDSRAPRTARNWVISALITDWATDQLLDNAASVTIGKRTLQFIKMPDGSYVAPAGLSATLVEEAGGDFVLTERFGNIYRFDADHEYRLQSITDQFGETLNVEYQADGKLNYVEDADGRRLIFTYSNDRISTITDSTARTVSYAYDSEENLISVTDPASDVTEYHYHDANTGSAYKEKHLIVAVENGKGEITIRNFYDDQYRVFKQHGDDDPAREYTLFFNGRENVEKNPLGGEDTYFFSADFRDLGSSNPLGERTTKVYDGQDHLIETLTPGAAEINAEYDADHNVISRILPQGLTAEYAYDSLHRPTEQRIKDLSGTFTDRVTTLIYDSGNTTSLPNSVTDPEGNVTEFTYHSDGQLHTQTTVSASGNLTTTYTYDSRGMPQSVSYPDGTSESFVYNERGDLTSETNRRGKTTSYQYNDRRQITKTTAPDLGETSNTYDSAGNLLTTTDPEGHVTRYTYSPQGKVLTETTAHGTAEAATTTHQYDAHDRRISTIDPLNRVTEFEHDAAGRVVKIIDPLDRETTFTYDSDGNRTSVTTPEGILTQFDYNERGERTSLTDPANNTVVYTHNAFGERTALNNRRSQTFQFTFDNNGNPLTTVTPLGHVTTLVYNDLGQVESVEEASGQTTTFLYDDAGRVESQTDSVGTIATTFDSNGNPLTVTEGSDVLARTFDDMDRVATYTDADGNELEYTYFKNGLLKTIKYPDDKTVTYAYDAQNRLSTVTDWSSRVTSYTWDDAGRLAGITRPNGSTRVNQYTDADELDRFFEYGSGQSALHAYARFGYDADSRIDWRYRIPQPQEVKLPSVDATYDIDNRVATWNDAPVTHDLDGNMTSGPLPGVEDFVSYNFDARNRLTSVGGTNYYYDAENNRIAKTDASGTTSYVIDPHGDALPRVLVREKPDGTLTRYVYGIGLLYEVDESDNATYYHFDQSGSTIALTDNSGAVTDRVEYSPFGTITHRMGTTDTPYLYAGQFGIQAESNGLFYMRARYYSPELKRFINSDPARFDGGMNWYTYANNSPLMYVDASGEVPFLAVIAIGAVLGGTIDATATTFNDVMLGNGFNLENTLSAFLRGAIAGGVSSIATPFAGTAIRFTSPLLRRMASVGISSAGSFGGQLAHNSVNSNYQLSDGLFAATALGGFGQGISNRLPVPRWGNSLSQMRSFGPKRLSTALTSPNSWRNHNAVAVSSGVSAAGNFLPQTSNFSFSLPSGGNFSNNNSIGRGIK